MHERCCVSGNVITFMNHNLSLKPIWNRWSHSSTGLSVPHSLTQAVTQLISWLASNKSQFIAIEALHLIVQPIWNVSLSVDNFWANNFFLFNYFLMRRICYIIFLLNEKKNLSGRAIVIVILVTWISISISIHYTIFGWKLNERFHYQLDKWPMKSKNLTKQKKKKKI